MKVKKTYSRKKIKPTVNIHKHYNITNLVSVNITYNSFTQGKPESSNSESSSSDLFDKLVKGPLYNVNNQSRFGSSGSEFGRKFFTQRQNTPPFYKSDAELSISTDISNHLFRDSKDSVYFPRWSPSPPPKDYKINNKLVKFKTQNQVKVSQKRIKQFTSQKKTYNGIQKKRQVARHVKVLSKGKSVFCNSSTPNRSNAILNKDTWPDTNVSPIMPPQYIHDISYGNMYETAQIQKVENHNSMLSVTALIKGLGNLGIQTPHHKNVVDKVNLSNQEPELFDYQSPLRVSINRQCEEVNADASQQPDTVTTSKKFEVKNNAVRKHSEVDNMNSCESFDNVNSSCKSGDSGDSTPQRKRLEEVENLKESELGQLSPKSPFLGFVNVSNHDVSGCSVVTSPCASALRDLEHSLENSDKQCTTSNILSQISEKEISNKYTEETGSSNISSRLCKQMNSDSSSDTNIESGNIKTENEIHSSSNILSPTSEKEISNKYTEETGSSNNSSRSCKEMNSDSRSDKKLESGNLKTENCEKYSDSSNCSLPGHVGKSNHCNLKEINKCNNIRGADKPLLDLTNLTLDTFNYENTRDIYKQSVPSCEEKRTAQYRMDKKFSLEPLPAVLDETLANITLEAGKKWRRSLLRQKQMEAKFNRRSSMSKSTLVRLIKESRDQSFLINDSKVSCNNTTRIINSLLEEQEGKSSSLSVPGGSPGFDLTFSKLSRIHMRRRRIYINDMNEIPEEISGHSASKCNETEFCKEESVLDQGITEECVGQSSVDNTTMNRTDVYETPPLLKLNPEALSAITDRKRSRRYLAMSFDECSLFSDNEDETVEEENNSFTSCCSNLEEDLENLNEQNIGKAGFLVRCGQQRPITFVDALPEGVLSSAEKIGEGVYGEVFMLERPGKGRSVLKIIPVEGTQMVNNAVQKRFDEVLSELIITEELSLLRYNSWNCTHGFCELKNKYYLQGEYPQTLLELWQEYDEKKKSENQCPDMFGPDQLYLALELSHAGMPVESFSFQSPKQALSIFLQTTFSLAVGEAAAEFEHRDLHIGNVLVQPTTKKYITFVLNGSEFGSPSFGTMATIIDCTLSRMAFKGDVLYLDLESDPELFVAQGDYQFDVYRFMRDDVGRDWRAHQPKTNIRWLHYLIDKFCDKIKYKQKRTTKVYKENIEKLVRLREIILDFYSALDLAQHLIESYSQTVSLIRR